VITIPASTRFDEVVGVIQSPSNRYTIKNKKILEHKKTVGPKVELLGPTVE